MLPGNKPTSPGRRCGTPGCNNGTRTKVCGSPLPLGGLLLRPLPGGLLLRPLPGGLLLRPLPGGLLLRLLPGGFLTPLLLGRLSLLPLLGGLLPLLVPGGPLLVLGRLPMPPGGLLPSPPPISPSIK